MSAYAKVCHRDATIHFPQDLVQRLTLGYTIVYTREAKNCSIPGVKTVFILFKEDQLCATVCFFINIGKIVCFLGITPLHTQ